MKKIKIVLLSLCVLVMVSGCAKINTTMTINKDKSMNIDFTEMLVNSIYDSKTFATTKEEYTKRGFTVTDATTDGYTGIKVSKSYKNIDSVSTSEGKEVTISDYLNDDFDDSVLFKVEKGFFKNKYTAVFKYSVSSENMDDYTDEEGTATENGTTDGPTGTTDGTTSGTTSATGMTALTTDDNTTLTTNLEEGTDNKTTTGTTDETTTGTTDDMDLSQITEALSQMEVTYVAVLPVKADSNNASTVSEDGKTLTWKVDMTSTDKTAAINYSFSLLNMTNIYIAGGTGIALILVIVIIIIVMSKKKKNKEEVIPSDTPIHTDYDPSISGATLPNGGNVGGINPVDSMPYTKTNEPTPTIETNAEPVITNVESATPAVAPQEPTVAPQEPVANTFMPNEPVTFNPAIDNVLNQEEEKIVSDPAITLTQTPETIAPAPVQEQEQVAETISIGGENVQAVQSIPNVVTPEVVTDNNSNQI